MDALTSARLLMREAQGDDLPELLPVYLSHPVYVAQNEGEAFERLGFRAFGGATNSTGMRAMVMEREL